MPSTDTSTSYVSIFIHLSGSRPTLLPTNRECARSEQNTKMSAVHFLRKFRKKKTIVEAAIRGQAIHFQLSSTLSTICANKHNHCLRCMTWPKKFVVVVVVTKKEVSNYTIGIWRSFKLRVVSVKQSKAEQKQAIKQSKVVKTGEGRGLYTHQMNIK